MTKSYIYPNLTISCAKHVLISILLITLTIFAYYAGIMLNALAKLICSKLCWHNRLKPIANYVATWLSIHMYTTATSLLATVHL